MLLLFSCAAKAQTEYNAIATAYVTTTISQNVVFDSTMQQGGTFTMSVLAHNGGGRAGQSDTANVKIQFYNSSGGLITSVNSTNSANLPNPNAVCGNPCIDTSVPWTTLTISKTLTAAEASQVAYATVSMYGIDGSFWAGDYGPWYRAPTFQKDGGGNLLYNPEFGPYNGITAQGWTSSPGFGACQGAWGGSNACIVNSDGVPGSSTVGLVANANGGGPSATGGTTSGTAGGYNNTMSVTNAGTGATAGAAPAPTPTVTGTSVTYTTRTVTSGNVTTVYRTPVTTTTYSDGTSTSTNGTEALYQTRTTSTVITNKIVGNTLTTISTPITTVNTGGVVTVEANGTPVSVDQTVQRGLNYQVWRYDSKTYSCGWLGCIWDLGRRTPSTNIGSYGNPVRTGLTTNGMYLATNARLPNGDSSWVGYNDNTVIRYTGTITIPITADHPAGSVYRIYFYNNTDDGFKLLINGTTVINQNSTDTWQKLIGYTSNGWLDVVAGQTYNLEGWYWNVLGGVGHRFYWDYGAGVQGVPNSAFTTGTISTATIDTTGVSYTGGVVDVTGAVVAMYPDYVTNNSGSSITVADGAGSSAITDDQQAAINDVTTRKAAMSAGNHVYIEQVGDSNTITILQTSNNNVVKGVGQTAALISGDSNNITIRQGNPAGNTAGRNLLELNLVGDANTLNLNQAQTTTGGYNTADSNDHYQLINVTGSRNSVTTEQTNINSTQVGHFMETTVSGNDNTLDLRQASAGKTMFVNVNGNSNSATVQQKDLGNHYLDLKMTGNGNNAIILQEGNVGHKATVDMSRGSGGANMLDLSQSSSTNPLSFSIQQTCNQANCGTVVIRQTQ
jgi:hypothetical protein